MIAKLGDFSEISKLTNVKNHIGRDIFHLFGLFRLSQTLRRLGMVKQCGHSASEVIQAMCMFKVLGETIAQCIPIPSAFKQFSASRAPSKLASYSRK